MRLLLTACDHTHIHTGQRPDSDAWLIGTPEARAVTAGAQGTSTAAGGCSFECVLHEEMAQTQISKREQS